MGGKIICVGNVVYEQVLLVDGVPRAGTKLGVLADEQRFGGPASTAAVAICRLGGQAAYWGRVGADDAGVACLDALKRHGVDCSGVAVLPEGRTLRSVCMVDCTGERFIVSDRRSLALDPSVLPDEALDGAGAVLVDSRWPAAGRIMLGRAAAAGILSVFDADGGVPADMQPLIDQADHVVFSSEGMLQHAGEGDPIALLRQCGSGSGRVFGLTRGVEGSLWLIGDEVFTVPAFRVPVKDTTGCGDVFHGIYALGLCEGLAPLEAARLASAAAAIKAERALGWEGMADRTSVQRLIAGGAIAV